MLVKKHLETSELRITTLHTGYQTLPYFKGTQISIEIIICIMCGRSTGSMVETVKCSGKNTGLGIQIMDQTT